MAFEFGCYYERKGSENSRYVSATKLQLEGSILLTPETWLRRLMNLIYRIPPGNKLPQMSELIFVRRPIDLCTSILGHFMECSAIDSSRDRELCGQPTSA